MAAPFQADSDMAKAEKRPPSGVTDSFGGHHMIISVSRRTDIPAHYADWFFERLREGYAMARNPLNARQTRRVDLSPEAVDGFVFWSKNPLPMLPFMHLLRDYPYYFQFTLNAYGAPIEPRLPGLDVRADALLRLSDIAGPERVLWRYDPILLSPDHTIPWHIDQFGALAHKLRGRASAVIISFLDPYKKIENRTGALGIATLSDGEKRAVAEALAPIARQCQLGIETCCEPDWLHRIGVGRARCVDDERLARIAGRPLRARRDPSQREGCRCAQSVDIGAYDCCTHGCAYCYANRGDEYVRRRAASHDPHSAFLIGGQQ